MEYEKEKDYAIQLIQKGILFKPEKCPLCGNGKISINKYTRGKKQAYALDVCPINVKKLFQ